MSESARKSIAREWLPPSEPAGVSLRMIESLDPFRRFWVPDLQAMDRMPEMTKSRREQLLLFSRNFFKHPRMLGSLIPSSQHLIDHLLRQVARPRPPGARGE